MAGSGIGTLFRIQTFGESHGPAIGVIVDGCPAGLKLSESDIQYYLNRRKPGNSSISTPRKEADAVEILSGVFEGKTTGCPIAMMIRNTAQHSADYSQIAECYRPGHADFTFDEKYGFRDYRGGGRSSGRETAARVAAGAIAAKILEELGITVTAYTKSIGPISINEENYDETQITKNPCAMPDAEAAKLAESYLKECMEEKDSSGGVIECRITGMIPGIGEPVFDKLDADLAKAIMSIGGVKAVEIGDGVAVSKMKGSENNDAFCADTADTDAGHQSGYAVIYNELSAYLPENAVIRKTTNHSGGTLGGISDGSPVILRAHIKPTPSIFREQDTVTRNGDPMKLTIKGRHDPVIVPRAVVVVECMCALTVLDLLMINTTSQLSNLKRIYQNR